MLLTNTGSLWPDASGRPIHAHGGGMIREGEYVYWFGENREGRKRVSCYCSANFSDWEFRGDVLTLDSPYRSIDMRTGSELITDAEIGKGANIERPKVVYNPNTGKFVMWMHWENGKDYSAARCAIATCDTIDGDYVYHGSFNPVGHMSRDCTLFIDDDGTAYFISAARENADLHIYRLSEDYLAIDEHVKTLWPGQYREAPVLMKRNGVYFMVTSGCTGWEPNQGKYAYAHSMTGRWSQLYDFGGPTTYDTQPTYILPIQGRDTTNYLYIGDRWDPTNYHNSSFVFLPLEFPDDRSMTLNWCDLVEIDFYSGKMETQGRNSGGRWRIRNSSHRYLAPLREGETEIGAETLSYASRAQTWILEPVDGRFIRIKNSASKTYLEPLPGEGGKGVSEAALKDLSDRQIQHWQIIHEEKPGWCIIQNRATGTVLTTDREFEGVLHTKPLQPHYERHSQRFLLTEHYGDI